MENNMDLRMQLLQMTSEQLKEMLDAEVEKDIPDDDLVLLILRIFDEREADKPVMLNEREKAAWKRYRVKAQRRARPVLHLFRTATIVAASLTLLLGMFAFTLPQEAKAGGIFDVIEKCTEFTLRFLRPGKENPTTEYVFRTENPGLQQLQDTVVDYGVTWPTIPMWIPEEYDKLLQLEVDDTSKSVDITAVFTNGSAELVFRINIFDTMVPYGYYKDLPDPKILEMYGTVFQYINNLERYTAVWKNDNVAVCITLDCQEDILLKILKSIYVMEAI